MYGIKVWLSNIRLKWRYSSYWI